MRVLDLFSGIGGFSLGLERAGMRTVAFCEIDPYCRRVLARHWPDVPCYDDVRTLTAARLAADGIVKIVADTTTSLRRSHTRGMGESEGAEGGKTSGWRLREGNGRAGNDGPTTCGVDVICGGFPCQDISTAGQGAGITGERSGLWTEYARIVGELRPRYVIVENVAALLGRGLSTVLGDLAALGYDAEWHCIPASAVGAPHRRDRVWIVAYPSGAEWWPLDSACGRVQRQDGLSPRQEGSGGPESDGEALANTNNDFGHQRWSGNATQIARGRQSDRSGIGADVAYPDSAGREQQRWGESVRAQFAAAECGDWWLTEPEVGRVAHGVPARVDRLRGLGNAVVPQIPEIIGRAIMQCNAGM